MTELWVERTGVRRYTGHSSRGAEVLVGSEDVDGVFTPGELLKIALAACSGMSSDAPLRSRLGDDYDATIRVSGPPDRENEVYPLLQEFMELDLSSLSDDEVKRLKIVVERATNDLSAAMQRALVERRRRLEVLAAKLAALSPERVLERGFSITRDAKGRIVRDARQLAPGDRLTTRLAEGEIRSTVDEIHPSG